MSLKDLIRNDIETVFLDPEEFADPIEWNGEETWLDEETGTQKPILAIVDDDETEGPDAPGVFEGLLTVYMSERYIPTPVPEEEVTLNGRVCYVRSVVNESGMLVITLHEAES